jgi:hypothetical protein
MTSDPVLMGILLSDYVIREHGSGKFSLIGTFHVIHAQSFPFIANQFFITILLTNLPAKFDQMDVVVRIEAQKSGHVLASATGNLKLPPESALPPDFVMQLPFLIPQFAIGEPGTYYVNVLVNNEPLGKRPFSVVRISPPPSPQVQQ